MLSDDGKPKVPQTVPPALNAGQKTTRTTDETPDSAERKAIARQAPARRKRKDSDDSQNSSGVSAPRQPLVDSDSDRDPSDIDEVDFGSTFDDLTSRFAKLKQQSLADPNVQPLLSAHLDKIGTQEAAPEEDLVLAQRVLDNEDDDDPETVIPGTTLVASDPTAKTPDPKTAKTPQIKDDDKAWKVLRKKIIAEAAKMKLYAEKSNGYQTIHLVYPNGKEAMLVERQLDKTLKLSSKPPTTPEQLIQLFLVTDSKICALNKAQSPDVAAKIYQALTNNGIKVTLHKGVIAQLQADPTYKHIAEEYLKKNPSSVTPTGAHKPTPADTIPTDVPTAQSTPRTVNPTTPSVPPDNDATTAKKPKRNAP